MEVSTPKMRETYASCTLRMMQFSLNFWSGNLRLSKTVLRWFLKWTSMKFKSHNLNMDREIPSLFQSSRTSKSKHNLDVDIL